MKPNMSLLVAIHRSSTGANVHRLQNLVTAYVGFCELDMPEEADQFKRRLYDLLLGS